MPFSMESNVRSSKRSGVWTMCPAWRSSSANAATPGVSPCAWWNNTTSAIFKYPFCNWLQYLAHNGSRYPPVGCIIPVHFWDAVLACYGGWSVSVEMLLKPLVYLNLEALYDQI